jgi:hypothetical protein
MQQLGIVFCLVQNYCHFARVLQPNYLRAEIDLDYCLSLASQFYVLVERWEKDHKDA